MKQSLGSLLFVLPFLLSACATGNGVKKADLTSKKFTVERPYKNAARCMLKLLQKEEYGVYGGTIRHNVRQLKDRNYIIIEADNPDSYQVDVVQLSKNRSIIKYKIKDTPFIRSQKQRIRQMIETCRSPDERDHSLPKFLYEDD